jgi:integrase
MKTGKEHRVPLSHRAVAVVSDLPRTGDHVFASARGGPVNKNALWNVLSGVRPELTVHGFRSTFRDWAAESTAYPNHVLEMALAHAIPNAVEAAYRRGDLFEKRRRLMDEWAAFCGSPAVTGGVVPMRGGGARG